MPDQRLIMTPDWASRLVRSQFPQWSNLAVRSVDWNGWDNTTLRLGNALKLRFPTAAGYVPAVEKEIQVLPVLASNLSTKVPAPIAVGKPGLDYPFPWAVYDWLEGEPVSRNRVGSIVGFAEQSGRFLRELRKAPTDLRWAAGAHSFHRGGGLDFYDPEVREVLSALSGRIDVRAASMVWADALSTPFSGPPVWVHGDFAVGNLLVKSGHLSAVIDFGCSAVGDPACDLVLAWTFFDGDSRDAFKNAAPSDPDLWARARGWALWKALITIAREDRIHPAERPPVLIVEDLLEEHANF